MRPGLQDSYRREGVKKSREAESDDGSRAGAVAAVLLVSRETALPLPLEGPVAINDPFSSTSASPPTSAIAAVSASSQSSCPLPEEDKILLRPLAFLRGSQDWSPATRDGVVSLCTRYARELRSDVSLKDHFRLLCLNICKLAAWDEKLRQRRFLQRISSQTESSTQTPSAPIPPAQSESLLASSTSCSELSVFTSEDLKTLNKNVAKGAEDGGDCAISSILIPEQAREPEVLGLYENVKKLFRKSTEAIGSLCSRLRDSVSLPGSSLFATAPKRRTSSNRFCLARQTALALASDPNFELPEMTHLEFKSLLLNDTRFDAFYASVLRACSEAKTV